MKELLSQSFIWDRLPMNVHARIQKPYNQGKLEPDASKPTLRCVCWSYGQIPQGSYIEWSWHVDEDDGIIVDAKYLIYAPSILVATCEAACESIVSKGYDYALRLSATTLAGCLSSKKESLPSECDSYLNLCIDSLEAGRDYVSDIPLAEPLIESPLPAGISPEGGENHKPLYPNWIELSLKQRVHIVREVIEAQIKPYVEMDGGGVEVINIIDDFRVIIVYSGACNGCYASTGATLSSIQSILRSHIHPDIQVQPQL